MPRVSHMFFKCAVVFLIIGILMGLQMSISGRHDAIGPHAHANLLGWVSMAIFGGYYALNPAKAATRLAVVHFWTYAVAVAVMVPTLYLLYRGHGAVEPLVALSSLVAFASVFLFAVVVFSGTGDRAAAKPGAAFAG